MRRVASAAIAVIVCALTVFVTGLAAQGGNGGNTEGRKLKNPVPSSPESIKAGQASYQKNCRFCHGTAGLGDGPSAQKDSHPSNLTDKEWTRGATDGEIFVVLRDGAAPKFEMKGFKGRMTDTEMWNVVNYVRSLAKK
jgi:mono/diheme cytochrome c family protein